MNRSLVLALLFGIFLTANLQGEDKQAGDKAAPEKKEPLKIGNVVFEGGDGTTIEKAVIIKNAKGEMEGIEAESKWIRKIHPGWIKGIQALLNEKGKFYDRIEYKTPPSGETKVIFFDITDFFGK